jgi:hypothetical protein
LVQPTFLKNNSEGMPIKKLHTKTNGKYSAERKKR